MSLHRFFCPDPEAGELSAAEAHHAATVLRLKPGNQCVVFNGEGMELKVELTEVRPDRVAYRTISRHITPPLPCTLHLVQAVTKNKAMDLILQKTTELGVGSIYPVFSDRSVSRVEGDRADSKSEKWRQCVLEACKQCGRNRIPEVHEPANVDGFIDSTRSFAGLRLIASLQPDARELKEFLRQENLSEQEILYVVGPEGDFTPAEIGKFRSAGFQPVSLGPNILRAETAAIFLTGVLGYENFQS
jgi:16S rRNA (uracil1498-N3)-methyltransferase